MDGRPTRTDCDEAGDYVGPNVLSPRDLVFRPDNMDETVPHKIEPWGTPALFFFYEEAEFFCTHAGTYLKDSHARMFQETPIGFNLNKRPLCHTQSNALLISRKNMRSSLLLSSVLEISLFRYKSWFTVESPAWKPDWKGVMIERSSGLAKY